MDYRLVTLKADGITERQIIWMQYSLSQQTDVEGQPVGRTRGGKIKLRVITPKDGNTDIISWMCDMTASKNGTITIPALGGGDLKTIIFKDGFVVEYSETYDRDKTTVLIEEFTISAKKIRIGSAIHDNNWSLE